MARFPDVCKDCKPPKRSVHCHSYCPDYLEAKEKHDINASMERKAKKEQEAADSASFLLRRN